jgi:glycosyltransferase involved in cell wall biosynthesis
VRVCFLIDELSPAGVETQLVALIDRLDRTRVEPYLCLLRGEQARSRALEPEGCPVVRLGVGSLCRPGTLGKVFRLVRFLRRQRIDVLQLHFPDSTYLGVLAGCLAGVPHILRTRDNLGYSLRRIDLFLGRLCNRFVDYTIAICEACRASLLADEGPPPESVVVLEQGVDLARFAAVPGFTGFEGSPRVGVVANLRPIKGLDLFLGAAQEVARAHPEVTFHLGGEGEARPGLERLAHDLGLGDRCRFHGGVADVPVFLAGLDVCVLCSHSEGMPNVILEYMAAGRPIVATAVGGVMELIRDGIDGLLVPPGDQGRLAGALRRVLGNPALAGRLAASARARVHERYSKDRMVRRFERFYTSLAAHQPGDGRRWEDPPAKEGTHACSDSARLSAPG